MIISHTHKFIFVKTRKTAGTSIEAALAQLCGPEDMITSDGSPRTQQGFYREHARNYDARYLPIREMILQDSVLGLARSVRDWWRRPKYYNHIAALSAMARTDPTIWRGYYKFCFERNPWDKMMSFYWFVHRDKIPNLDFNEYVLSKPIFRTKDQHYCSDWNRYTRWNRIIVDKVYDFSDIHGGLADALTRCGVSREAIEALDVPRLKSSTRKARGVMSRAASDRLREVFAHEIAAFGYAPPEGMVA